ncbi:MAG: hypothetical protein JW822_06630 [Spirochaetales bacterium]|nr:hypothetical protein [Spirochaetales bacterium]
MRRIFYILLLFYCLIVPGVQAGENKPDTAIINYVFTEGSRGHQQIYVVDKQLKVYRLTDYKEEHHFFRIFVSSDRKKIAFQVVMHSRRFLRIIDINSSSEMKSTELLHNVIIHNVSWSADDKYIAVVCGDKLPYELCIIDSSSFAKSILTNFDVYSPVVKWSRQGHKLLFVMHDTVMFAEAPAKVFAQFKIGSRLIEWDENGQGVIVFSKDIYHMTLNGTKKVLYANVMQQMLMPQDHMGSFRYPGILLGATYSLDRKKCILYTDVSPPEVSMVYLRMYFIDIENKITIPLADVFNFQGSNGFFDEMDYRSCDFSPDSKRLVCDSNGGINILDMESGTTVRTSEEEYVFRAPEFSADGRYIFFKGCKKGRSEVESVYYVNAGGAVISGSELQLNY